MVDEKIMDEKTSLGKENCNEYFLKRQEDRGNQLISYIEIEPKVKFYGCNDAGIFSRKIDSTELMELREVLYSRIEIIANLPTPGSCGSLIINASKMHPSDSSKIVEHSYLFGRKYTNEKKLRKKFEKLNKKIREYSSTGQITFNWEIHGKKI